MSIQGVSSSPCWKYDVFLSFRGEDTRKKFTDHLYTALKSAGINVFRDDKELKRGKEISTELLKAIEESRFSIVVFSRNYASSTWCLDELVKIVECMNPRGQTVLPIFYDVDPSILQNQGENFQEAFVKDEEVRENTEKVEKWKTALRVVANLSGWDAKDRYESELVKEIVRKISCTLSFSKHGKNITDIVGLDSHLEKLKMIIGAGSNDVRMIGICGMGGIGKTTIARAIFESISSEFEGSSFVENVREVSKNSGLISLQKQILSQTLLGINIDIYTAYDGISMIKDRLQCRKVLIILDDVDHAQQLNNLAEKCEWFGSGSRIIITTRDEHLLKVHGVHETYMVEKLEDDEAFQLFSLKAFKKYQPPEDFLDLSKRVVQYASGLPLALKVLGCHLCGRNIDEWKSAIDRLGRDPEKEILDILEISFDGLNIIEKKIFLDIACFFKGHREDYVKKILDGCHFDYDIGIAVLIEKCLITRSKPDILTRSEPDILTRSEPNILWMHDLLQEMGHQIILRESPNEPGDRSRLWKEADIKHVLTKNTGTKAVEGIMSEKYLNFSISAKAFSKMANLRLLKIYNVQLLEGLDYLSDELRLLIWHGYPLKSLPSSFQPDRVVDLELCCSLIEQLWKPSTHWNMLTSITLQDCRNLNEIPNLTCAPNLVRLFLAKCPKLLGIHKLVLKKLKSLEVRDCTSLMTLPGNIYMKSITHIWISGCPRLKRFPEIARRMEHLKSLHFEETAVREMPSSIELLTGLEQLDLLNNNSLVTLPSAISNLKSLVSLSLFNCSNLKSLPDTINGLTCLRYLLLSHCSNLVTLPDTINGLTSLEVLVLSYCSNLVTLPHTLNGLTSLQGLDLFGCSNLLTLTDAMNGLTSLQVLNLSDCSNLVTIPAINGLISLQELGLNGCSNLVTLPDSINGLISLQELGLNGCSNLVTLPDSINGLISLQALGLNGCSNLVTLPDSINGLISLQKLGLNGCSNLVTLPDSINGLISLQELGLNGCSNLESLPTTINGLQSLETLLLDSCTKLDNVPETLGEVASLRELVLSGTAITQPVSSIFLMKNLETLTFRGCKGPPSKLSYVHFLSSLMARKNSSPKALMLPSLSDLCSLTDLDLSDCNLGEGEIPFEFFSSLLSLEALNLSGNNFLSLPTTIRDLPKLRFLDLSDCKNLQSVPELPSGIEGLNLSCCAALETLSNALKHCNSKLIILCVNCLKLFGGDDFINSVVKVFLKVESIQRETFCRVLVDGSSEAFFPGGDIPNWVRYKSEGSSISIERPPGHYNNKLVGFILCSVFVVHKNLPFLRGDTELQIRLQCHVKTDEVEVPKISPSIFMNEDFGKSEYLPDEDEVSLRIASNFISRDLKSEHIWLRYLPHEEFKEDTYNYINLSFEVEGPCGSEVKSCGIHPIYEQDLTEFNPTTNQPIVNVATTYANLPEHDDDEPQPKRFKKSSSYWQNLSLLKYVRRS